MGIITNINSLQGMGIYADRGARSPSLQFRRYNLVYGFNGSGKSTLSRLFASLEAGEPHPKLPAGGTFEMALDDGATFGCPSNPVGIEQRLLVFNSDYVEQNLQWAAGRANPVFYIGADQAEAASELSRIEGEIVQAEARKAATAATEKAAEKTFANYKRERAKLVASRLHLGSRKYEAPALAKDYDTWKDDGGLGLTDDQLKAAEEVRRLDEPMPRLQPVSFDKATIETAYRFIADVCGQSLATVALDEVQRHPDMLLWLKHGHEYHEAHAIADCLLCGNAITAERRVLLAAALDDSVDQFVARLNKTAERLSGLIESSTQMGSRGPTMEDLSTELRGGFRDVRENLSRDAQLLGRQLGTLQAVLSAKLERPATPADMKDVAAEADVVATAERLAESVMTVNEAISAHNQAVTDFEMNKAAAETSIRRHFIVDCRDEYAKAAGDLDDATGKLKVETDSVATLRERARELRQRIRTHGPAAGVINKLIAAYLGHGEMTINPVDEGYELQRHGTPITGVPSEGEKTAIAISYFLSSIEADNRKLKDVIVVVDDPVSSLDTKALNFACSLVRTRLENAAQVFILTHNLQCMNEFRKAWKGKARPPTGKDPTATFLYIDVTVPEGQPRRSSKIIEMSKLLREYDSEYHFLFSHVLRFVQRPDAYDDHGYMMPNVIRRVLDVFLAFKSPGGGGLPGQLDKLCSDYPGLDREQLAALERLAQVESHSDNLDDLLSFSTMTLEETRGAAAVLFAMMEHVDGNHIKRLKGLCQ
ncbi:Wobble nucleotide-excising tRNase [Faunimonas pinastri]|uniref:Wobble nucleotide-excising tRNase n=1 Tax=Faunimonas pinastri TaxID=1855383 RepID=A0A1H9QFL5_9HYPH|nr:AAA family ATPase [Faunimonas pinastri]SER59264.1 Wobble nucleotide-excising tRNase [Faunimonas pinastri]